MDKQKQIFEKLGFGPFLANLSAILFLPRKEKGDVFYASANYKVQEPNYTRPDDHRNHFEHDVIMTVVHCGERMDKGKTRRKSVNKFVLSIEIILQILLLSTIVLVMRSISLQVIKSDYKYYKTCVFVKNVLSIQQH